MYLDCIDGWNARLSLQAANIFAAKPTFVGESLLHFTVKKEF